MMTLRLFTIMAFCLVTLVPAAAQERRLPQTRQEIQLSFAPVVQKAAPAVVNVFATRVVQARRSNPFADDPFFRRFFGDRGFGVPRERAQQSLGSGVIVESNGLIVTNNHVVDEAQEVKVVLADRREFEADILLKDERTDLAVLRIRDPGERLPFLELANSDDLLIGDLVLAIGNPFGVGQTVTSGIVSALARNQVGVSDFQSFIQTDAAINPGNSGGALIDLQGRLVGINTAIFTRGGGSIGIGFAIPVNMVQVVLDSARGGRQGVRRPWLGADLQDVTPDIAHSLGLRRPVGALVASVLPVGPAARGGMRSGDVIIAVNGFDIDNASGFQYRLATLRFGGSAATTVLRDGAQLQLDIAIEPPPDVPPRETTQLRGRSPVAGATIVNINPAVADELRLPTAVRGAVVAEVAPRSPAASLGLQPGDIVREVNDQKIRNVRDLSDAASQRSRYWRISIERGGRILNVVVGG